MEALIDDLLSLAHEGRTVEASERVDLDSAADAAWRHVETRGADLRASTDATVLADAGRLQQLLENCFRNSVVHGSRGDPGDLTVTVGRVDGDDGDPDGFYVADDGRGIPAESRDSVFEAGESSREDGTGFGLAIVSRIADAHGWSVSVTDSEAGGARFDVTGVEFA
jgi:signal transduction histidine kinase